MGRAPGTLTDRDAGVDIEAGNRLVERAKPFAAFTERAGPADTYNLAVHFWGMVALGALEERADAFLPLDGAPGPG